MTSDELVSRCRWPDLPEHYAKALHAIVEYVTGTYDSVIGIIAAGTIIRGTPDPTSDFDIYVVHAQSFRQRIQRYFHGVPAEIFVNPPSTIETYLQDECTSGRPITAHMLATGFKVLDLDPAVEKLCAQARDWLDHPPAVFADSTMSRYLIASAFEDALDVSTRNEATARMIMTEAVERALKQAFLLKGLYIPRPKDLIIALDDVDRDLAALARRFYSDCPFPELLSVAERIVEGVAGAKGFFEWESEPEAME